MIQYDSYWLWLFSSSAVFWILPDRFRLAFLTASCLGFLAVKAPTTVSVLLPLAVTVYGLCHSRRLTVWRAGRLRLWVPVLLLLSVLFCFKYLPVIIEELAAVLPGITDSGDGFTGAGELLIPLGISYFTFKLIHYAIESSRGNLPEHRLSEYFSYVFLLPILTAGPIERFDHYKSERLDRWSIDHFTEGLGRIAHGLIKKFVFCSAIFSLILELTDDRGARWLLANLEQVQPLRVIAFLVLTYLFVYMDFSSYSDIAIGSSRLFGLRIMENFNFPVFAPNIGNIWTRWHITLSQWCRSYIYMPLLGLTRNPYFAVFISTASMGVWHGASSSWLCWGIYNGLAVATLQWFAARARKRKWQFVKSRPWQLVRYPLTFLCFAGSFAFTTTQGAGGPLGALTLLAKCFGLNLN